MRVGSYRKKYFLRENKERLEVLDGFFEIYQDTNINKKNTRDKESNL